MNYIQALMLIDIFSSFDPATRILINIPCFFFRKICFWVLILVPLILFFCFFWVSHSPFFVIILSPLILIKVQCSRTSVQYLPSGHMFIINLFFVLIIINLVGLVPYVFSVTRHLVFTLSFGFPLWLRLLLSGITYSPSSFVAGILPGGAPWWLNPFLIFVEIIRIAVRPLTLSFRLAANITAGHVVIVLLSFYCVSYYYSYLYISTRIVFLVLWGYLVFELGISLIQAYIFCLLLSLYANDHPGY